MKEEKHAVQDIEIRETRRAPWWEMSLIFGTGLALFILYMVYYVPVMGGTPPKTNLLKSRNIVWRERFDEIGRQLDRCEDQLAQLEERDDRIYRSVYGMDEVPQGVRLAGLGGENRYDELLGTGVLDIVRRVDVLEKRVSIQSESFDEVEHLQRTAGDRAAHIPAIPPISTEPGTYHFSSPFGYRSDPFGGYSKMHTGMDLACHPGNPVYATGDGVVAKVEADPQKGYGLNVILDHGFGYQTRYAHLSRIDVVQGQKVNRGDCIGASGNSGRSSGPHLHYEVLYRKDFVNPAHYFDMSLSPEDYFTLVRKPEK
ncbi:MAG: M23 family metallopeptidase [Bacteroidales bacterium]|nr:M23 family metallopeptidase [Bacteroidales bacterium]